MWEQQANNKHATSQLTREIKVRRLINQALSKADFSKVKVLGNDPEKIVIEISNLGGAPIINVNGSRINK